MVFILKIRFKLYASLRKHLPRTEIGEEVNIDVEEGTSIRDILIRYGIEEHLAKIIFVNGLHQKLDYVLQESDLLVIFPPVGGG